MICSSENLLRFICPSPVEADSTSSRSHSRGARHSLPAFKDHKLGPRRALDGALDGMVQNGWLMECKGTSVIESFGHHGKTYRVLDLPSEQPAP
jgi:hypothetical protein